MKRRLALVAGALVLSCGGQSDGPSPADETPAPETEARVTSLPAELVGPEGQTVSVSGDSAALVYLWLPLPGHSPTEGDLRALAGIHRSGRARALPIQLDAASRNLAQTQVNGLGLSMPVYLADSSILESLGEGHLPAALLATPGRHRTATGFGSPSRLLLRDGDGP